MHLLLSSYMFKGLYYTSVLKIAWQKQLKRPDICVVYAHGNTFKCWVKILSMVGETFLNTRL